MPQAWIFSGDSSKVFEYLSFGVYEKSKATLRVGGIPMWEIGQWVVLVCVVLAFLVLIWSMAKLLFKVAVVVAAAVLLIFTLNYFSLLPEEAQKYLSELVSQANIDKARTWVDGWTCEPSEGSQEPVNQGNSSQ